MISVVLFKGFAKDHNSTLQPVSGTGAVGYPFQCDIFEPCSVLAPVIKLAYTGTSLQTDGYNYASIPTFGGRYYWITDMIYQDGFWFIHLAVDVLATYKTQIGSSSQYIQRSAYEYNENLIDTIYLINGGRYAEERTITGPFTDVLSNGTFVIGYSSAAPVIGSNAYAVMTSSQARVFLSQLMGSGQYLNLDNTDLDSNVAKAILNPIQYIQSVKWFPFSISGASQASYMFFGWWTIAADHGDLLISDGFKRDLYCSIPIPKHSQASTRGKYLCMEPYSYYRVYLPVLGYINLDALMLYDFDQLDITYTVDIITGVAHVVIEAADSHGDRSITVIQTDCNIAIDIPIAQIYKDELGATKTGASTLIGGVASLLTGNIAGGISTLINGGVDTAVQAVQPIASFSGSVGNLGAFHRPPTLELIEQDITGSGAEADLFGRPLCEIRTINTIPGYIMCGHAHVAIEGATSAEISEIEGFMNGGFFYE